MSITYEKLMRLLKANLLLIIAAGILCFGVTFAYMKFIVAPVYSSTAKFFVETTKQSSGITLGEINADRAMVDTYLAILDSNDFYQEVYLGLSDEIRMRYGANDIRRRTAISSINGTEVMSVTFSCEEAAYCQVVTEMIVKTVGTRIGESVSECNVHVTDSANEPAISNDKTRIFSIVAFVAGALIVFLIVLLRDMVDLRIKTVDDLTDKYKIPILGAVPTFKGKNIKGGSDNG